MTENQVKEIEEKVAGQEKQVKEDQNPLVIHMPIKKSIQIDGREVSKLTIDFSNMTGADILSVDSEMRLDGHPSGFDHIYNQDVLLKLASRATGVLPDDLQKLHGADFLELVFQVRNFFIRW